MSFWQTIDVGLFRFINQTLSHPVLDWLMPFLAWNKLFVPAVALLAVVLVWKGGARGRLFVLLLAVIIGLGDPCVTGNLKEAVGRPRPFLTLPDVNLLVGRGRSASMPSSHASSWFAATLIALVYYRRSWRLMLPLATLIGVSRVYVGVHYPSDVAVGAILGAGYAAAGLVGLNYLWRRIGPAWFPGWFARLPSLLTPEVPVARAGETPPTVGATGSEWLRLGYLVIGLVLVTKLAYLASGEIELSEDEAYQWVWSKHLALSYYSKPPLIAYTQFLGTSLWGDTEFGVRFFSPVLAAGLSLLLLRFLAREVNPRAGFWLIVIVNCTPLLAVGSTLMTVDPLLVFFWTAAMLAGWRAVQPDGAVRHWVWVGVWLGLALLSKYTALLQLLCWALFFGLWAPARVHLRRPGPYLAALILLLAAVPILVWNAQHGWVTVEHVAVQNAELGKPWQPTLKHLGAFLGAAAGALNPVFFGAAVWAMIALWKRRRHEALPLFLFSMGAPVLIVYTLFTLHSHVEPNWIAAAVPALFCLAVVYWDGRWAAGVRAVKSWLAVGAVAGGAAVVVLHDTDVIAKIAGRPLPPRQDPLRRVRGWSETARVVERARQQLLTEGKDVFIIGSHYGMVGQMSFYVPAAKAAVTNVPLAYFRTTPDPRNQFYFWPGYREQRPGQNAIFVQETRTPHKPPPPEVLKEFESITDLGFHDIKYRGRVLRQVQLHACRHLR